MIGNTSKLLNYPDRLSAFWLNEPVVPVTIELHLTDQCNQNCRYCRTKKSGAKMSHELIVQIFSECLSLNVAGVYLSGGGEPLLGNIEAFVDCPVPCGLITNGSVPIEESIWGAFKWVRFSVDTSGPETYRRLRGTPRPICLEENIHNAVGRTFCGAHMVLCQENAGQCADTARWAKGLGLKYLAACPDIQAVSESQCFWPSDYEQEKINEEVTDEFQVFIRRDRVAHCPTQRCHAANFWLVIGADGECYACACDDKKFPLGNLNDSTLTEIVYSERRKEVLASIDPAQCAHRCKGRMMNEALAECRVHGEFL